MKVVYVTCFFLLHCFFTLFSGLFQLTGYQINNPEELWQRKGFFPSVKWEKTAFHTGAV